MVGDLIADTLESVGVKRIYGVVGDSLNGLTEALRRDALTQVRRELWAHHGFRTSATTPDLVKLPHATINALTGAACYAA